MYLCSAIQLYCLTKNKILARNPRFKLGDALCFFVLVQGVTAEDTPVVQVYAVKLTLSLTDTTSLSALCTAHAASDNAGLTVSWGIRIVPLEQGDEPLGGGGRIIFLTLNCSYPSP